MKLEATQSAQVQQAKLDGQVRTIVDLTDEQKRDWRSSVEQELVGKDDNVAHLRKILAAAEQPGFFGDVRRSLMLARKPVDEIANAIGVEPRLLSEFRAGEASLPPAALDRLIEALGLRLMQEIPH